MGMIEINVRDLISPGLIKLASDATMKKALEAVCWLSAPPMAERSGSAAAARAWCMCPAAFSAATPRSRSAMTVRTAPPPALP